eukprot:scaffold1866_cov277-Pinguiococcus_pyrenoidosus.AAC.15
MREPAWNARAWHRLTSCVCVDNRLCDNHHCGYGTGAGGQERAGVARGDHGLRAVCVHGSLAGYLRAVVRWLCCCPVRLSLRPQSTFACHAVSAELLAFRASREHVYS